MIGTEDLARRYEVKAMPLTFLIDRSGAIASVHAGIPDGGKAAFEREIQTLLEEPRR